MATKSEMEARRLAAEAKDRRAEAWWRMVSSLCWFAAVICAGAFVAWLISHAIAQAALDAVTFGGVN